MLIQKKCKDQYSICTLEYYEKANNLLEQSVRRLNFLYLRIILMGKGKSNISQPEQSYWS